MKSLPQRSLIGLFVGAVALASGCAATAAQTPDPSSKVESTLRQLRRRLRNNEARLAELNDQVVVLRSQLNARSNAPKTTEPVAIGRDGATSPLRLPDLEVVTLDPVAKEPAPISLTLHEAPEEQLEPLDVTDVPPPSVDYGAQDRDAIFTRALEAFRRGQFVASRDAFESFVDQYPGDKSADNALYWIGECSFELGEFLDAVNAFRRIVNEYPSSKKIADALFKAGLSYERLGESGNARKAFQNLVRKHPNSAHAELAKARL